MSSSETKEELPENPKEEPKFPDILICTEHVVYSTFKDARCFLCSRETRNSGYECTREQQRITGRTSNNSSG